MIPVQFDYATPNKVETAVELLNERFSEAEILAGGHSLFIAMTRGEVAPALLIDLSNIPDLEPVTSGKTWEIGAMATYDQVANAPTLADSLPALAEALAGIGDPQIRNWGRVGDTFAYRDLACDLPTVALALGATFTLVGVQGSRVLTAEEFVTLWIETQGKLPEIVTAIHFPTASSATATGSAYESFKHPGSFYTLCAIATWLEFSEAQIISNCRVAAIGAIAAPMRLSQVEEALLGQQPSVASLAAIAPLAQENLQQAGQTVGFPSDLYASSEYRIQIGGILTKRGLKRAIKRAGFSL